MIPISIYGQPYGLEFEHSKPERPDGGGKRTTTCRLIRLHKISGEHDAKELIATGHAIFAPTAHRRKARAVADVTLLRKLAIKYDYAISKIVFSKAAGREMALRDALKAARKSSDFNFHIHSDHDAITVAELTADILDQYFQRPAEIRKDRRELSVA